MKNFLTLSLSLLVFSNETLAYIDPGTGSLIVQIIVAAFLGVSFFVKVYWKKLKQFFSGIFSKKNTGSSDHV